MVMSEAARRLVALLRLLELSPSGDGVDSDDALLDAWFGVRSPLLPSDRY
jgi:hypothetical protein